MGLANLVFACGFIVDEAQDSRTGKLSVVQPLSTRVVCSRPAWTKHGTLWASHIPWIPPINGASITVGVKTTKAATGDLDLGKAIVSHVSRRPPDDMWKSNPNPDARSTRLVRGQ
jgi:hypothetical protein